MPSATGPSLAGILAVVAGLMTGSVVSAFCGTEESPALLAAHGELAAMDAAVFPRFASSVDSLTPVSIDVYVHVIASSADKVASVRRALAEELMPEPLFLTTTLGSERKSTSRCECSTATSKRHGFLS